MLQTINSFVQKHNLLPQKSTVVLGLSGGPDSIFLLHYLTWLRDQGKITQVIAAHLDHQWRPTSQQESRWCNAVCTQLNVPFVAGTLSTYLPAIKHNGSREEIARIARRTFFEDVRTQHGADLIALAHHLQDQEETFFIRLIRGSSLTGLTSIWPKNGVYVRPLLETNKEDMITYLHNNHIDFLTDPSNVSHDFLRNRIRATVLPPLQACDDRFDSNFVATINRLQETESYLKRHTEDVFAHVAHNGTLDLNLFLPLTSFMQYRILMHWLVTSNVQFPLSQAFLDEIIRFLHQPGSKDHQIAPSWKLVKRKNIVSIGQQ